jgi:DNA-binding NarL/FixJ family response regulator
MDGVSHIHKVMVVEDHPLFCEALSMTLREGFAIEEVAAVTTLAAAIDALGDGDEPDVVFLDLNLPDVSGVDGLIRIKTVKPDVPVIVISSLNDNRVVDSVLKNGAAGFVSKDSSREKIIEAFQTVADGGRYEPDDYVEIDDPDRYGNALLLRRLSDLTPQQGRILAAICEGKLNKQIAYDHAISEATVKAHVTAILRKLGVQSRTQAVLIAQKVKFDSILHKNQPAR